VALGGFDPGERAIVERKIELAAYYFRDDCCLVESALALSAPVQRHGSDYVAFQRGSILLEGVTDDAPQSRADVRRGF
jgi:hypothetical protein